MYYILILVLVAADQTAKHCVRTSMCLGESVPVINNVLHITYVSNNGGAFSILQGQTALLIAVPAVLAAAIAVYIHKNRKSSRALPLVALSLICGGGMGNFIDRVRLGAVVDFIDFRVFPVFNVADICVCCGCGLLFLHMVFLDRQGRVKNEGAEQ
ncbi:MAG: signal peptidase II [Clostridiales bacterium]|nr:signal peptidase II [Clostridiales bacterium]